MVNLHRNFKWIRLVESVGIVLFCAAMVHAFYTIGQNAPMQAVVLSCLSLPLAYFCADFLTGVIHWVCDSFGDSDTPLWGPMIVAPFRRHHRDPLEITRISLAENLGASAIVGVLALWLFFPVRPSYRDLSYLLLLHFWLWLIVFAVVSNLFHRWSHLPRANKPRWMLALQKRHVILNTTAHLVHHRKPYRVNYCILSGWANPLSNRVPWQRFESALAKVGIPTNFD